MTCLSEKMSHGVTTFDGDASFATLANISGIVYQYNQFGLTPLTRDSSGRKIVHVLTPFSRLLTLLSRHVKIVCALHSVSSATGPILG